MLTTVFPLPRRRDVPRLLAVAVVYIALGHVIFAQPIAHGELSRIIWPASGASVALLLMWGPRLWPGVTLGALLTTITTGGSPALALSTMVGNTAEALVAVHALRWAGFRNRVDRAVDVLSIGALGAVIPALVAAAVSAPVQEFVDGSSTPIWILGWRWWLSHAMGVIVIAPTILVWSGPRRSGRSLAEAGTLALVLVATTALAFGGRSVITSAAPLAYLPFPVLIWAAFRFRQRGATAAALVTAGGAMGAAAANVGPFAVGTLDDRLLFTWAYVVVTTFTPLLVAALVSEGRHAEVARRASEDRLGGFLDQAGDGVLVLDAAGRITEINPSGAAMLGQPRKTLTHVALSDFLPREASSDVESEVWRLPPGNPVMTEWVLRRRDGSRVDVEASVTRLSDGRVQAIMRDVTERKRNQQWLAVQSHVLHEMTEGVTLADESGHFIYANPAMERMFGYESGEMIGLYAPDLNALPDDENISLSAAIRAALDTDGQWRGELRNRRRDGSTFRTEAHLSAIEFLGRRFWLGVQQDVTERRRLEEQVRHSQKMEAIGMLAGGVAHDFNNLMTAILGHAEFVLESHPDDDKLRIDASEICRAARRAADLTQQLLAFARKQIVAPKVVLLDDLVFQIELMLVRVLGEHIALRTVPAADARPVRVDPAQLEQVILNLALNARDAMPNGGELTIKSTHIHLSANDARDFDDLTPGSYVVLEIADTGHGIAPDVLPHIFEPFFTTKDRSGGTGLGLSMAYGTVKQAGGEITVDSSPLAGSTFRIYLPEADASPAPERGADHEGIPAEDAVTGKTILVVEDEPLVRKMIVRTLERSHRVLAAEDGEDAIWVANAHGGAIDLIIMDVVLPRLSGKEAADRLRHTRQGTPILFISGYAEEHVVHHGIVDDGVAFLSKPFTTDELYAAVGRLFARREATVPGRDIMPPRVPERD